MCTRACANTLAVERMERTRGAGVSFPLFIGKTPWKRSQLSMPKLIQEFLQITRQETWCCSPLPPLLFCSPVNTLLISLRCSLTRQKHKADSYSNSLMTRVYLAEWSAFHRVQLVASCGVCVNTKPFKTIDWRSCCQ